MSRSAYAVELGPWGRLGDDVRIALQPGNDGRTGVYAHVDQFVWSLRDRCLYDLV